MAEQEENAVGETAVPVMRDPNFQRFSADMANAIFLGNDVEIMFFAASPHVTHIVQADNSDVQSANIVQAWAEVARARVSPLSAFNIAINIIRAGLAAGSLSTDALKEQIDRALVDGAAHAERLRESAGGAE